MSKREDIPKGRLVYSCNCGWLDRGHIGAGPAKNPTVGQVNLWNQLVNESGARSKKPFEQGFKVTYRQENRVPMIGSMVGETRVYLVKLGLGPSAKESVALSILKEVSMDFEAFQTSWGLKGLVTDSGFSQEDLVSNLIGFYVAVRPALANQWEQLCGVVSATASLAVWDAYGAVGSHKNRTFRPRFWPCKGCSGPNAFPKAFDVIQPAIKGTDFRDWTLEDELGPEGVKQMLERDRMRIQKLR